MIINRKRLRAPPRQPGQRKVPRPKKFEERFAGLADSQGFRVQHLQSEHSLDKQLARR